MADTTTETLTMVKVGSMLLVMLYFSLGVIFSFILNSPVCCGWGFGFVCGVSVFSWWGLGPVVG